MLAHLLASQFQAYAAALPAFAGLGVFVEQDGTDTRQPPLIVFAAAPQRRSSGRSGVFELSITVESIGGTDSTAAHIARVALVDAAFAQSAGRAAAVAAINAAGVVILSDIGQTSEGEEIEAVNDGTGDKLRSKLVFLAAARLP